jgi:hypothetical protein
MSQLINYGNQNRINTPNNNFRDSNNWVFDNWNNWIYLTFHEISMIRALSKNCCALSENYDRISCHGLRTILESYSSDKLEYNNSNYNYFIVLH